MALNDREKRTITIAVIGLAAYLAIFYGRGFYDSLEEKRHAYEQAKLDAMTVNTKMLREIHKQKKLIKLRAAYPLELDQFDEPTLVGDARVALEQLGRRAGASLSISREMPGRSRANEAAVFNVSGGGKPAAVALLLHIIGRSEYPWLVQNVEIKAQKKPGTVRYSFTAALLKYDTWEQPADA